MRCEIGCRRPAAERLSLPSSTPVPLTLAIALRDLGVPEQQILGLDPAAARELHAKLVDPPEPIVCSGDGYRRGRVCGSIASAELRCGWTGVRRRGRLAGGVRRRHLALGMPPRGFSIGFGGRPSRDSQPLGNFRSLVRHAHAATRRRRRPDSHREPRRVDGCRIRRRVDFLLSSRRPERARRLVRPAGLDGRRGPAPGVCGRRPTSPLSDESPPCAAHCTTSWTGLRAPPPDQWSDDAVFDKGSGIWSAEQFTIRLDFGDGRVLQFALIVASADQVDRARRDVARATSRHQDEDGPRNTAWAILQWAADAYAELSMTFARACCSLVLDLAGRVLRVGLHGVDRVRMPPP